MFCHFIPSAFCALVAGFAPDFGPPTMLQGFGGPYVIADFNRDGKPDIAVVTIAGDSIKTLLGVGDGTFQQPIASSVGDWPASSSLDVGDFNADGIPDLVTQVAVDNWSSRGPRIFLGVGDGTFQPAAEIASYGHTLYVTVGDLNGDQASDLVVTIYDSWGEWWYVDVVAWLSDGHGGFTPSQFWDLNLQIDGWAPGRVMIADFNNDGIMDWSLPLLGNGFRIQFYLGNGGGSYAASDNHPYEDPNYNPYDLSDTLYFSGDFNNDGATDVAVGSTLFMGRGDGTFQPGATVPFGEATGDFNGDRNLDIVGSANNTAYVTVGLGFGDGTFGPPRTTHTFAFGIKTADFNGDGLPDVTARSSAGISILLNDGNWTGAPALPQITIGNDTATEGDAGTTNANFIVRLSFNSLSPVTVQYATSPGPVAPAATPGVDYQETNGVLTFAPGEIQKTISVPVVGDLLTEPIYEYFVVNLSNPANATIGNSQGICAIYSEESPPVIYINNVSRSEGDKGQTKFTFEVTTSAPIYETVTVSYRTSNGTATTADGDYGAASGTLNFSPGQRTKTITVNVRGDRKRESDEVFYVDLFSPSSNASLGQSRGTGTILNDD